MTACLTFLAAVICLMLAKWPVPHREWAKSLAPIHTWGIPNGYSATLKLRPHREISIDGLPVTRSQCTGTREGASSIERERLIYPFLLLCLFASAVEISSTGLP